MYGGFDVYKTYLAIKNHFTTDYDFFKYAGNLESLDSIQNNSHNFYAFEKIDICDVYAIVWNHYRYVFDEMMRMMRVTRFPT